MMNNLIKGIYIHIPFCHDICFYCDFAKVFYEENLADEYLNILHKEFQQMNINSANIESIYIGGGTPSSLNYNQLKKLFDIINPSQYPKLNEFTIEVNPEHIDNNKIDLFKSYNINRVSIGVQTFNNEILKSINRKHSYNDVIKTIDLLRKVNINNISIDLMYGFNNQSIEDIKNDLNIIKDLDIDHVAVYSLILEEATVFSNNNYQIHEDEVDFGIYINDFLQEELDYEHYEVSNYARNKKYSKHNLLYWSNERYYGLGMAASGFIDDYRYYNTKSITNYLKEDYNRTIDKYKNETEMLKDEIIVSFRKYNGIDINALNEKYSIDFTKDFEHAIINNRNRIFINNNKLYFSEEGKLFLNDIIIEFLNEIEEW